MNPTPTGTMSEVVSRDPGNPSAAEPTPGNRAQIPAPPELPDFQISKLIGQGTFGTVWLAKERITGVYRAIKTFPKTSHDTEITGLCEFQRRALNHPHLMQVYLIGQYDGIYYVVTELADDIKGTVALDPLYYEPRSLERLLEDRGAFPPAEACEHINGMLEALDYLHGKGLVHRDVKPANVLFVGTRAKLCDFGLIAPGHRAVDRAGTHGYWRPDGPTDRESDLYALTKVAYQMFTGSDVASFSELPAELARQTSTDQYNAIREFLERGCSPNHARRYTSAQAMLRDLKALRGQADPAAAGRATQREPRRAFDRLYTTMTALALLVSVGLLGWMAFGRPSMTPFSPLADMTLVTYPPDAGNPNSLAKFDPEGQLAKRTRTFSTSNPQIPDGVFRFANVQVISNPASHVLLMWISPSGYMYVNSSEGNQRSFRDPLLHAFRSLDGEDGNYVICAFLNDRPFKDKNALREAIERLAARYRDEHAHEQPLPPGTARVLYGGGLKLIHQPEADLSGVSSGFGLLGEIWIEFRHTYPIVGIELPLPRSDPAINSTPP